ncbi:MAG: DUF305 domain-containing protein [Lysobacter sp.]
MNTLRVLQAKRALTVWTLLLLCLFTTNAWADAPAPHPAQARYEVRFLTSMIDHHAMAAEMASTCESKPGIHDELRELCTDIRIAQRNEIDLMQGWLGDWYGVTHSPQMSRGDMRKMEKLASLTGAEYEIAFMTRMVDHHSLAIRRASGCLLRAHHDDLVDLCVNIIEAQVLEIRLMRMWLCEWHGLCGDRRHASTMWDGAYRHASSAFAR